MKIKYILLLPLLASSISTIAMQNPNAAPTSRRFFNPVDDDQASFVTDTQTSFSNDQNAISTTSTIPPFRLGGSRQASFVTDDQNSFSNGQNAMSTTSTIPPFRPAANSVGQDTPYPSSVGTYRSATPSLPSSLFPLPIPQTQPIPIVTALEEHQIRPTIILDSNTFSPANSYHSTSQSLQQIPDLPPPTPIARALILPPTISNHNSPNTNNNSAYIPFLDLNQPITAIPESASPRASIDTPTTPVNTPILQSSQHTHTDTRVEVAIAPATQKPLCQVCIKNSPNTPNLSSYMMRYASDRPYQCSQCHRTFTRQNKLAMHQHTHSGSQPFACPICHRRFTQRHHMHKHITLLHQNHQ